ncbi:MAG: hypothetical protein HZA54_07990 [Planctomycetes bacterium]|nr:hypothetical protein [Planctomycetota bacterium]
MKFSETQAARLCSRVLLVLVLISSSWLAFWMGLTRGRFALVFTDLGKTLPPITILVLSPGFFWSVPVLAVLALVKEATLRNPTATLIANGVHLGVVFVMQQTYFVGVHVPLIDLVLIMVK